MSLKIDAQELQGLNPKSGKLVEGGIKEQTKQALNNLDAVLKEAGMDYDNVVRATVYLSDMNNFQSMNSIYKGYFNSPHPPARSTVEVRLLPKGDTGGNRLNRGGIIPLWSAPEKHSSNGDFEIQCTVRRSPNLA